jgi:lysozyme family protein
MSTHHKHKQHHTAGHGHTGNHAHHVAPRVEATAEEEAQLKTAFNALPQDKRFDVLFNKDFHKLPVQERLAILNHPELITPDADYKKIAAANDAVALKVVPTPEKKEPSTPKQEHIEPHVEESHEQGKKKGFLTSVKNKVIETAKHVTGNHAETLHSSDAFAYKAIAEMIHKYENNPKAIMDTNGYLVQYGINAKSHPNAGVGHLTFEKAVEITKKDYWDKLGLSGKHKDLSNEAKMLVLDAAFVQGPGRAAKWLNQCGNNPEALAECRKDHFEYLAQGEPAKYGQYLNGWLKRVDRAQKFGKDYDENPDLVHVAHNAIETPHTQSEQQHTRHGRHGHHEAEKTHHVTHGHGKHSTQLAANDEDHHPHKQVHHKTTHHGHKPHHDTQHDGERMAHANEKAKSAVKHVAFEVKPAEKHDFVQQVAFNITSPFVTLQHAH